MLGGAGVAGLLALALACTSPRPSDVVVIASGADLESANPLVTVHPLSRQVQRHLLFVTLFRLDSSLAPQPYLARRSRWSADRRWLELTLYSRLRWHDGARTTARDVAFTFLAARDPRTGYPRSGELATLDTVVARDDSLVVFRFTTPQTTLPALLSELPIVPAHILGAVPRPALRASAFGDEPVGNGPFRFASRRRGTRWTFVRNDSFPAVLGGPPRLRGVAIAVVDEATTKFAALTSGELDVAGIAPSMAALARRDASLRVLTYPVLFSTALYFNTTRPPFDDVRVRRAVALSLDRQRIVEVALAGFARASSGPVPPDSPLAWRVGAARDTRTADALLDEAGWRRGSDGWRRQAGRSFDVELLTVGAGENVVEQLVQSDLAERGLRVRIRQTELGSFLTTARTAPRNFDVLVAGVPGDLSLGYLDALFASDRAGGTLDYTGFHSAELDALLARARRAPAEEAAPAWGAVQRALDSLAPATWLYHSEGVQGMTVRLRGVRMDLRGELATISRWSLDGERAHP